MTGNPYPVEVLESGSFPIAFLSEPEPIPDVMRVALTMIAKGHLSAKGARDLARLALSHLCSSTNGSESLAEAVEAKRQQRQSLVTPFD